jgi:hypothetical protein
MSEQKSSDQPLLFAEVFAQEIQSIRPNTGAANRAPLSALCISGGGIRSATFGLGVIQGLAEYGVLDNLDYLSTVSGGGYIGSWLTAWKQRRNGLAAIVPELVPSAPPAANGGPDPVHHLREYNNYLSPKLGLLSADTWTLVATVARNLFLNWLVLIPLLLFALMLPRIVLCIARIGQLKDSYAPSVTAVIDFMNTYHVPRWTSAVLLAVAVFNTLRYLPGIGGENRSQAQFLRWVLAPFVLAALGFIVTDSWFTGGDSTVAAPYGTSLEYLPLLAGTMSAILLGGLAWLIYCLCRPVYRERMFARIRKGHLQWFGGMLFPLTLSGFCIASGAWLLAAKVFLHLGWPLYVTFAGPLLMLSLALAVVLFVGVAGSALQDEDREWLSRAGAWWLLLILAWTGGSFLVLQGPHLVPLLPGWTRTVFAGAGGLGAIVTALGGLSSKPKAGRSGGEDQKPGPLASFLDLAVKIAAAIFVIVFLASLALLTNFLLVKAGTAIAGFSPSHAALAAQDWWTHGPVVENTPLELALVFAFVFLAFAWLMARCININRFSLHGMYRNRLIRAYLGASNDKPDINKFTGFDQGDDLHMGDMAPGLKPFHVVNATLNLVAGKRLDWQQRKAECFTISPLHCGNFNLGYRPSREYGGKGGISLGTAMALSGAAASPNMGYYSSPVFGFIMTLLNARLGAWLGNPGPAGDSTWRDEGPRSAVQSLVREAFGLTNEKCPYIYLSDGGHFENLGVYEMVRRRCRYIIVLDGAADGDLKFGDLGNALRKVRIDFKVSIKFQDGWEQELRNREKRWAVGTIGYSAAGKGEDGYLIYIKPLMCGTEPPDVVAYHADRADFPHESTADQFFNESQTESYRVLGIHTVNEMCEGLNVNKDFPALVNHIRKQTLKRGAAAAAVATG